jgi:hypothetical protein
MIGGSSPCPRCRIIERGGVLRQGKLAQREFARRRLRGSGARRPAGNRYCRAVPQAHDRAASPGQREQIGIPAARRGMAVAIELHRVDAFTRKHPPHTTAAVAAPVAPPTIAPIPHHGRRRHTDRALGSTTPIRLANAAPRLDPKVKPPPKDPQPRLTMVATSLQTNSSRNPPPISSLSRIAWIVAVSPAFAGRPPRPSGRTCQGDALRYRHRDHLTEPNGRYSPPPASAECGSRVTAYTLRSSKGQGGERCQFLYFPSIGQKR